LASKHTASKIQIYKQHNSHQFKKPRLNRILQEKSDVKDEDFDTCDEDSGDDDKENKGEEDNENIDESDKENYINHHNSKFSENFSDNVSDDTLHKHFDKLAQDDIHSLSPEEVINYSDIIDEVAFPKGHDHRIVDEVEEEEEEEEENLKHKPMEPVWTNAIYNELQHVVRKYSRSTLDENDEDTFDVTMVAEYAPEIFNYLHELENRLAPDGSYMENQDELKWEMRSVLIDWVVQVHSRFNLLPETLYLTVNYIDRFLSKRKVSLSRFQLVGAVALFIAAKYEEINCPTVQEVAYMADNAYSIDDFLKAERFMIDVLEFDMGWPGPMSFLRRTSKADDYDYETRTLAKYFW
jgi:Cyclin